MTPAVFAPCQFVANLLSTFVVPSLTRTNAKVTPLFLTVFHATLFCAAETSMPFSVDPFEHSLRASPEDSSAHCFGASDDDEQARPNAEPRATAKSVATVREWR